MLIFTLNVFVLSLLCFAARRRLRQVVRARAARASSLLKELPQGWTSARFQQYRDLSREIHEALKASYALHDLGWAGLAASAIAALIYLILQ